MLNRIFRIVMFIPLIIYAFIMILLDDGYGDETYW